MDEFAQVEVVVLEEVREVVLEADADDVDARVGLFYQVELFRLAQQILVVHEHNLLVVFK
eukprot:CAMPEP_0116889864 /NCGR_PEP_ID=MMETSP0467-20121206/418_1 /TAXON_ID=283647 /ORGANISM="Mesodinium pulex, Strain SPMC105" /LENGTH=59 /DNA_ID=CAMNT_0004557081 /DNA_START=996 /DNA_END=1175 /DNA_ORIENTATION=+